MLSLGLALTSTTDATQRGVIRGHRSWTGSQVYALSGAGLRHLNVCLSPGSCSMGEVPFPKEAGCLAKITTSWVHFHSEMSVFIELEKGFTMQEGQNLQVRDKYVILLIYET